MMRYFYLFPLLVCLARPVCADPQPSPQLSGEEIKAEFDISVRKETGTVFFVCKADACGKGSTVSEHPQGSSPLPNEDGLQSEVDRWLEGVKKQVNPDAMGEVTQRMVAKLEGPHPDWTYLLAEVHLTAKGSIISGVEEWWTIGFISNGKGSMTFASSSTEKELAWRNANAIVGLTATTK